MSGYKSTYVSYDRRGELVLNIRTAKDNLLKKIKLHKDQVKELKNRISREMSSIKNAGIRKSLNNYVKILGSNIKEINKSEQILEGFTIKTTASLKELEKDNKTLTRESDKVDKIVDDLKKIGQKVSDTEEIDKAISALKSNFIKIESLIKNNNSIMKEWIPQEYDKIVEEDNILRKKFNEYKANIDAGEVIELKNIREIYKDVISNLNEIERLVTEYTAMDNEVKKLKNQIEGLRQAINEHAISTKNVIVKDLLSKYLDKLAVNEKEIEGKKYEGIGGKLDNMSQNISLLRKADEINSNIEKEVGKINSIFKENDSIFKKWVQNEYEIYLKDKEDILNKLDGYKNEIQRSEIINVSKFNEILINVKNLSEKIDDSFKVATEKDQLHQKRLYVIKALRGVCYSLGFKESDKPHYEEKDNVYSRVTQNFDTLNLGTITFHVTLDGKIESSSGITIDECGKEFSKVSKLLKEQFGVKTSFRRVEEDEPINKKYKTAKDLPCQRPEAKCLKRDRGG